MVHNFSSELVTKKKVAEDTYYMEYTIPDDFSYLPGQFLSIVVQAPLRRSYSILETKNGIASFLIDVKPGGPGSIFFEAAQVGDKTNMLGPLGRFFCQETQLAKVFIATGTGIVPFVPMIKNLKDKRFLGDVKMFFGTKTEREDIAYDYLKHIDLEYYRCVTRQKVMLMQNSYNGRVTKVVPEIIQDFANTEFYICGSTQMILDVEAMLKEKGADKIYVEKYG